MQPDQYGEFVETGLISPARMRAVDANAMALGVTELQLMESAGRALADQVLTFSPARVLILCGKGNNGGDGMVAARHLQRGVETAVLYLDAGKRSRACEHNLAALRHTTAALHPFACREDLAPLASLFGRADVIVDSLLGTGSTGGIREPLATCIAMVNSSKTKILSADVPTPGLRADRICAFHRAKVPGSMVVDIGIPAEAECTVGPGDLTMVPARNLKAHKGAGGTVLVIGGGPYQGAPYLAGLGALRAGADIVRVASPAFEPIPDLIYERLPGDRISGEHTERLIALAGASDVVVIGNGLGTESHAVVQAVVPHCRKVVLDADALRLPLPVAREETILTPHAGEFSRITGKTLPEGTADRARVVRDTGLRGTVILKGKTDIITDGSRVRFNRTGHPAMTVGGTGDVLAGISGGLLCHLPAFDAACIAAYVNGMAGQQVATERGEGMIASDLVDRIPGILFTKGA